MAISVTGPGRAVSAGPGCQRRALFAVSEFRKHFCVATNRWRVTSKCEDTCLTCSIDAADRPRETTWQPGEARRRRRGRQSGWINNDWCRKWPLGINSRNKPTSNGHVRFIGRLITRIIFSSSPCSSLGSSPGSSLWSSPGSSPDSSPG